VPAKNGCQLIGTKSQGNKKKAEKTPFFSSSTKIEYKSVRPVIRRPHPFSLRKCNESPLAAAKQHNVKLKQANNSNTDFR